ncbi:MAG: TIR domain-containing protein [Methylobacter sp.]
MAYRNGTYVAFHANGTNIPSKSDIDYYNLMKAWAAKTDDEFTMNNSHDKAAAVRDSSRKETLKASLLERLKNSKNMVLIIGNTTLLDDDWVPFEIEKAVDIYKIPIIAAYTGYGTPIRKPAALKAHWPSALATRINNGTANVIHIPFKKMALLDAISQFSHNALPKGGGLGFYSDEAYRHFGIVG